MVLVGLHFSFITILFSIMYDIHKNQNSILIIRSTVKAIHIQHSEQLQNTPTPRAAGVMLLTSVLIVKATIP